MTDIDLFTVGWLGSGDGRHALWIAGVRELVDVGHAIIDILNDVSADIGADQVRSAGNK